MLGTFIPDFSITTVSANGRPYGMHGGIKVFVEKGVPGDVADISMIRIREKEKLLGEGKIISLKKKSALRIDPFCKHFVGCGGCQWQNISYADQLKVKQQQVQELFSQFRDQQFEMLPILPSSQQKNFRNRVTFTFSNRRWMSPEEKKNPDTDKRPAGGYVMKGNNDRIMNIEECFLTDDFSVQLMHSLREKVLSLGYSFYDVRHETGFLRQLIVRFGDAGEIMAIVVFGENDDERISEVMNYLKESFPQLSSLYYVLNERKRGVAHDKLHILFSGNSHLNYTMDGFNFRIGPTSFYQTNSAQALVLYKIARTFAQLTGEEIVYDLYTGSGTIALFVSHLAKKVIGIDNVADAIADAKVNAHQNKIANSTFIAGDLKDSFSENLFREHGKPDVIITDPPRAGMHREGIEKLISSGAKRIVYISCNPLTQVRDIRNLSAHYGLVKSQPVDMFPQTSHVENVVLLERK